MSVSIPDKHPTTMKVGPKGRHITLPDGATVVTGTMRKGDLVANIYNGKWENIDREDIGQSAEMYELVCRVPQEKNHGPTIYR